MPMNVAAFIEDAARSPDPTGTAGLRRSFRAAGKLRMNMFRSQMRQAVIEHDVLGLGGGGLALQPPETRLQAFNGWARVAAERSLEGPWLSEWIARAWASGEAVGALQTRSDAPGEGSGAWAELARIELESIAFAVVQVLTREAAVSLTKRRANKVTTWRRMGRAFDKIGPVRIMALANTFCVACHNRGRLAAYRAAGITKVGVIPERLLPKQALLLPGGLGDQIVHDAKHIGYKELGPARPEYTLSEVEEPIEVGVRTAGDEFVCIECDAFAENSPHDIDDVEDTLPIHRNCRCTWYPWDDQRFRKDAADDDDETREELLERLGRKRHRALARLAPRKFKNRFMPEDAWDPSQPRGPDGKWAGGSDDEFEGEEEKPGSWFKKNYAESGRVGGYSVPTPEEVARYHRAYEEEGKRVARFARRATGPHDAWNPDQPREPAGSPEGGEFASAGGGKASAFAKKELGSHKYFKASNDVAHHHERVKDVINKEAARNPTYRWTVGKYIDEAKHYGALSASQKPELDDNISALKSKIAESFWLEGMGNVQKGNLDKGNKLLAKGTQLGFAPTPQQEQMLSSAKVPPIKFGEYGEIVKEPPSIPVATPAWTKIGPQKGSVAGGMYGDPQGNTWYVKTPKTEAHVNADLLSNALYKLAGVSVSDEVKTVLEGKSAVASMFKSGYTTLAEASAGQTEAAHKALQDGFAVDAWLGNRDVIGQGQDNILVGQYGQIVRLDQGGTLMYRAQGETKPFGVAVDEITSMRSSTINPQTSAVFGKMTDAEVSASIDKVLAIPSSHIKNAVQAHGMPSSVADTLIARRDWLAEYQKTLNVPGVKPWTGEGEPQEAWMTAMEAKSPPAAAQPKPTAAELEKAKKVGPYYPAPTSEMGKVAVKAFNEKWASKAPGPDELEQKVAEYKATKAALTVVENQEQEAQHKAAVEEQKTAAAKAKAANAAAEAKAKVEAASHQAELAKIAADIGIDPEHAEQVNTLVQLAGGDKAKLIAQFKKYYDEGTGKHGYPVTPFESAMIQSYVGPNAYAANAKLRSGVWDDKTHVFANAINAALTKLPPYQGTIKRGFTADSATQATYVPGAIIQWHGFSSCGKSGSFGGNMQCTIEPLPPSKTRAKDLGKFNPIEAGGEVLIKAHTPVKVVKVEGKPGGTMHIWLKEVEAVY